MTELTMPWDRPAPGAVTDEFRVERVLRGSGPLVVPAGQVFVVESDDAAEPASTLCGPQTSYPVDGNDLTVWVLDLDGVRRIGTEVCGLGAEAVEFTGPHPVSPALGRYWRALTDYVRQHLLDDDEVMASPLVRAQTFRQLATGLLAAFPNTTQADLAGPGSAVASEPGTVRRAVEYIEAHAQDDIDVAGIAEAARIGVRGLQQAFRKHRGQTPLEFLRKVRMERVHRDLRAADPTRGDTVAGTAARWGFTHPGRFSVDYRETYGCSPSQTLRS